jgi:hypothetical protein
LVVAGPRITWRRIEIADDVPVERYVVTRHLGPISQVACDVPAGRSRCVDAHPPAGYLVTYTVAAAYGSSWTGLASQASNPVLLPGEAAPIYVDGVMVLPGADGGALVPVPGASVVASAGAVTGDPGSVVNPADPGSAISASPDAPVIVPPAPPESEPGSQTSEKPGQESGPEPGSTADGSAKNGPAENAENENDTQTGVRIDATAAAFPLS